jgi:hypothetical protein
MLITVLLVLATLGALVGLAAIVYALRTVAHDPRVENIGVISLSSTEMGTIIKAVAPEQEVQHVS